MDRRLRLLEFLDSRHIKVVRLSALRTGRLDTLGTHICYRQNRPQGHSAAEKDNSMKNLNDCSASTNCATTYRLVTTALGRVSFCKIMFYIYTFL